MTELRELKRGEFCTATWANKNGTPQSLKGVVLMQRKNTVYVQYYYEETRGSRTHFGMRTTRRPRHEVTPREREEGELSPDERIDQRMAATAARRKELAASQSVSVAVEDEVMK